MFCKNCGAQIDDSVSFCTSCGTKIEKENRPEAVPAAQAIQPGAATPAQREAAASAAEGTRLEAAGPVQREEPSAGETLLPEAGIALPPPAAVRRKEKLFFGTGALVFCLVLIAALSISTGVFAGLYFSLISRI